MAVEPASWLKVIYERKESFSDIHLLERNESSLRNKFEDGFWDSSLTESALSSYKNVFVTDGAPRECMLNQDDSVSGHYVDWNWKYTT